MSKPSYQELEERVKELEKVEVEYKKVKKTLSECEEKYKGFFENTKDILIIADIDGNVTYINKSIEEYGFKRDELIGKNQLDFIPEKYWQKVNEDLKGVLQGKTVEGDIEVKTPKGIRLVNYKDSPIKEAKKIVGFQTVIRDITERKQAEEELKKSEERLGNFIESSPDAITVSDLDGRIIECNQAALDLHGFSTKEALIGKSSHYLIAPQDRKKALRNAKKILKQGFIKNIEYTLLKKDGSEFEAELSTSVVKDSSGKIINFIAITKDITARKQVENELLRMHKELETRIKVRTEDLRKTNKLLQVEIIEHKKTEKSLYQSERELKIMNQISNIFLTTHGDEMYGEVLQIVLETLKSKYGVFGYIDEDDVFVCPSMTRDIWSQCQISDKDIKFPRKTWGGIWGKALIERKSIYSNKPFRVPEGHIPIIRALDVPITYQDEVIGNLLVGNKETDYDKKDQELLETIANRIAPVLHARLEKEKIEKRRNEAVEELKKAHDELETRVKERTARLREINDILIREIEERKKTEEALKMSEEKFRTFMETASDWMNIADKEGNFVFVNQSMAEALGYTKDELEKMNITQILKKEDVNLFKPTIEELGKKGEVGFDTSIFNRDGKEIFGELKLVAAYDNDGNYTGSRGIFHDITERKNAEEKLQKITNEQSVLLNTVPAMIFWIDKKGNFIRVNKAFAEAIHKSPEDINGKSLFKLYPKNLARSYHNDNIEVIESGIPKKCIEELVETPYGAMWVSTDKIPYKDERGNIIGIIGFSEDITERKKAEEALRESENKFRDLANLLPQTVFEIDKKVNFTFANRHGFKSSGYTQKDIDKGLNALKLFISEDRDRIKKNIQRILKGEKLGANEYTALRKDGSTFPALIYSSPIIHKNKTVGLRGIVIDITERKKAEEKLRRSQEQYQAVAESAFTGICIADIQENITYVNPAFAKMLGYTRKQLLGMNVSQITDKEEFARIKVMSQLRKKGIKSLYEAILRRKNGVPINMLISGSPLMNADGNIEGTLAVTMNITERKKAEEKLLYERNLFQTFLNNIPDRIYFKDKNARFVRASKSVVDFFNTSLENIIGKTDLDFYEKQFAESKLEDDLDVIKTEKPIIGKEAMDITMDGIKRWGSTTKLPWYDDNNNVIGIFGISRDITELKKKEEELKVSHKMLRNLSRHLQTVREKERMHIASEIHDDLGQALTALQIDLFWLENKLPADQNLLLDKIKTMLNLIDKTIRNVQRISSELRPALLEELGLVAEIESEAEEFQERTGIKCETNIDFEDVILGKELSIALFRIFQETLTNITRHADAAKVKIGLQKKDENLILVIEDNGKGITVEQISDPKSFGLIGMRERIYPWNGEVKIIGRKNKGTTVTVSVPVYQKGDNL